MFCIIGFILSYKYKWGCCKTGGSLTLKQRNGEYSTSCWMNSRNALFDVGDGGGDSAGGGGDDDGSDPWGGKLFSFGGGGGVATP